MAELQCIQTVKQRSRNPSLLSVESKIQEPTALTLRKRKDNTLYTIEVVEENETHVKVHYVGYDPKFDEWKPKQEIVLQNPRTATDFHPLTELACQIKKRLLPSRHEDPSVRIQIPATESTFSALVAAAANSKDGKRHTISSYDDLVPLLGEKWFLRIANRNGDFSYAILSTIEFHMATPRSLMEYETVTKVDGTVDFIPVYIEQSYSIVFTFVRGDGTKQQLFEFL